MDVLSLSVNVNQNDMHVNLTDSPEKNINKNRNIRETAGKINFFKNRNGPCLS